MSERRSPNENIGRERTRNTMSDEFYERYKGKYDPIGPTEKQREERRRKKQIRMEKARRRRIRRIKMVVAGLLIITVVVSIVVGICMGIKSCMNDDSEPANGFKTVTNTSPTGTDSEAVNKDNVDKNDPLSFVTVNIEDNDTDGNFSSQNAAVYLWEDAAYEIFGASADRSDIYADAINKAANSLGDDIKTYSMMVPLHAEMNLPQRLKDDAGCTSQSANISNAYKKLKKTQPINVYNVLAEHNNEYLYFKSDHHWTGLGAYYAYTAFCEQTGQEPMTISEEGTHSIEGFTGSFHTYGIGLVDRVDYYDLPYSTSCMLYINAESVGQPADIYYQNEDAGENSYGVFINGDNAKFIISSDCGTEKKIAVVKESFGNAFVPYLSANYSEIHVLDMRQSGVTDLKQYCNDNGINEVLFINNMMSANSGDRVTDIENMIS